jgi:hypothetical protein
MRLLFALRTINFDRVFEGLMRELLERGHTLDIVIDLQKGGLGARADVLMEALRAEYPGRFSYTMMPERDDAWLAPATALRHALDYVRYLQPQYADATKLRERAHQRVNLTMRVLLALWGARRDPRRVMRRLQRLEAAIPVPPAFLELLRERRPDALMVAPVLGLGSSQAEYFRAARRLGIPSVWPVASWDNLTNKGQIRDVPDLMIVWNEHQIREAVELHDVPRERLVATGAHTFDHWFAWGPRSTREEFAAKAGVDLGDRGLILYVCSSRFIAPREADFVREWLGRLRAHADPRLADAAVIIRPHPQNTHEWQDFDAGDPRVTVWPRGGAAPTDDARKADYFDSIHHAFAVVGVNTSALIETAIVGRPVLTLLHEQFAATQGGTLHFAHLAGDGDEGLLTVARTWDEHLSHLERYLHDPEAARPRIEGFLRSFVRPHGLDVDAAPRAADAIEALVARGAGAPQPQPRRERVLLALAPLVRLTRWLGWPRAFAASLLSRRPAAKIPE